MSTPEKAFGGVKSINRCQKVLRRRKVLFRTGLEKSVKLASWNVGSLTGKSGELVETLERRGIDVCCIQETRWKGEGVRFIKGKDTKYKIFYIGSKEGQAGVAVLIRERWVDKVVEVKRINSRLILVKLIIGECLVSVISAYAPQAGRTEEEKDDFWEQLTGLCMTISDREMIMIGGDLNGHVGERCESYEGVHGDYGFGSRNQEGVRILDFAAAMDMVVCNTLFKKEVNKLVTFSSGGRETTVDYILTRRVSRHSVRSRDVKAIPGECCVSQQRLLV